MILRNSSKYSHSAMGKHVSILRGEMKSHFIRSLLFVGKRTNDMQSADTPSEYVQVIIPLVIKFTKYHAFTSARTVARIDNPYL